MKKTARNILLFVVVVLLLTAFTGCKPEETPVASGSLQVNTIKIMPYAYMGESFDLRDVLLMEEGVEYSATACYVDLETMTEYALEVNDLCFTPVAVRETVVVITAKRGGESAAKVIYIPTTIRAEPLDDLYKSSGTLGGSDPGISKDVNIDPAFLQGDSSTTSLHVSFNSADPHPYGNTFMNFSREEAQQYFSDQTWENAIVTFWVYNPSELPIEFQLRIVDDQSGVNADWQTADGPHKQRAEPGQWTQIFFSLRKLGVTHRLTSSKFVNDLLLLKFRYDGYSTTETYSFDFYIDNVDVVDASMYPDVDTKFVLSNETIEQGWENMAMDKGWQGVYTEYDYEFIKGEGSTCSLKAYFNSEKSLTNSFICLSPEAEFDENPDMTGGILSGYFKFENMDPKVSVDIVNKSWETSNRVNMDLKDLGDGWYFGTLNLEDIQVGTGRNDQIIRIRLNFSGVTNDSVVYVDTLIYEYKYVEKVLEYADTDLINMSLDSGSYYNNVTYSYVTSPVIGSNTVRSLKIVAPSDAAGRFTWNTDSAADKGELSAVPNMSYGTLGAWFYFGKQLPNATFQVTSDNWKGSTAIPFVFTKNNGDGWYYGELHGSNIKFVEDANAKAVIRWTLIIPQGYTVCVDNLNWTTSYENPLVAAEIDPSVLYDGGDMLAGTDNISYDKRHWENVENTDDFDKDGVVDPDLTKGLTCGVDTENLCGDLSVRSWYFKAAADNNFGNAAAQLRLAKGYDMTGKNLAFDIKIVTESKVQQTIALRLQSTGWRNINEQDVIVKLNPGDWRTVVVDFSDVLLEDADVANLGFISLYFDFAANTGKDRAIYIDNVRLTTDAATGNDEPLPLGPEDQFDGGDMLANTNTVIFDKTHWDNIENSDDDRDGEIDADKTTGLTTGVNTDASKLYGQYSVRNWYFKAAAANNFGNAIAQLQLAQTYDLTGKNLAFDILVDTECKFQQPIGIRLNNSGWKNINEQNVNIKVNPGEWKHVVVSFDDVILEGVDITTLGFISFYFDFAATTGFDRTIYIDNVVLTTEAPTAQEEPLVKEDNAQNDWTNMVQDKGEYYCNVETEIKPDKIKGEISTKSLYVKAPADVAGKLTFNTDYAVQKGELDKLPNMNAGTLGAWFYFGDGEPYATVKLTESFGWKGSVEVPFVFGEGEDGWYYGTVDCSTITYSETSSAGYAIRVTIGVPAGFEGYIDSMTFVPGDIADPVAPETTEPVVLDEDPDDLLGVCTGIAYNKDHWVKANGLTIGHDMTNVYGETSTRSWAFKASAAANLSSAAAQFNLGQAYDMTGKNLAFDIKIVTESKVQQQISVRLHRSDWKNLNDRNQTVKLNPGEWKTVVMSFDGLLNEGMDFSDLGFISFYFDFAANTGKDRAIYIDNVRLTTDAATGNDEPLPLGPEDQFDGGDMLANTNTVIFDKTHWDNIENSDDDRDGEIDADKTTGLTTGVNTDASKLYGQYSVRNWYFSAVASNNFSGAAAQLQLAQTYDLTGKNLAFDILVDTECKFQQPIGIRLNNSGWKNINEQNVNIKVNPGEWKHVVVSFDDVILEGVDITTLGFISFYFDFAATTGFDRTIYIDNVVLTTDAPTAEEEPLVKEDNAQNDWTNMVQDKGEYYLNVVTEIKSDKVKGEISTKSLYVKAPADVAGKLTFNTDYAVQKGELDKLPNMNAGTLGAWFYFGDSEPYATVKLTESFGWKGSAEVPFVFGEGEDGWYYGTVDCSTITYSETSSAGYAIRVTVGLPAGFEGYIDSMTFVPGDIADPVAPETTEPVVLDEDPNDLLGNCTGIVYNKDHWVETNGLTIGHDMTNVYGETSTRSWAFKASAAANLSSAAAQFNLGQAYDMTGKNLAFDIKIVTESKVQQQISVRLHRSDWKNLNDRNQTVKLNPGEWKTVVMSFDGLLNEGMDFSDLGFISFYFDFAANTGKDRAIYIDNVRLTTDAATGNDEPLPLGPEDQFDGGDMLANTNTVIFDKTHWDNIENSDDDRDGEIDADKTTGLTTGVNTDASKLYGQYSVRNWYFSAVASNNFSGAAAQLQLAQTYDLTGKNLAFDILVDTECKFQQPIGIRLNNSGWKNINEQNVNIKVNPGEWKHVVVSFDDVILEGVDITTLGFISFYFDFAATTGFDRTIYIDNVCLTDEPVTAPEEPLVKEDNAQNDWTNMVQDKGDYYCNVESVIKTDKIKGEISTKSLYVKAPVMTSQPSDPAELFDDGDMLAYTNTISYNLTHWDHIEKGSSVYEKPVEEDVPGKLTFNLSYAVEKGELDKLPNMNAGTLGAWFYFGENEPSATVKLTESFKWKGSVEVPFVFGEGEDGWYYGTVDCSTITYSETTNPGFAIRVTIGVPVGFEGYIDSMTFEPGDIADPVPPTEPETTVPETTKPVTTVPVATEPEATEPEATVPETTEPATSGLTCGVDEENVYGEKSVRSWYFKAAADSNMANAVAQLQFVEKYDITGKNLAFDIKIDTDSKLQQTIGIRLHNSNWGNLNDSNQVVKLNPGDWRTVVVSFADLYNAGADLTDLKMISFYFDFAANTGKDRAIYIDNVRLTTDAATGNDEPLPLGPEDMFDGGDLLASTDTIEYNRNHWENISNTHDLNSDGVADEHVTAGLTVGVDDTHLNGQYSVRSWYFKAAADANFNGATAQFALANVLDMTDKKLSFDVYYEADTKVQQSIRVRLHSKSTGDMFADQTVKVNPGEWKTIVMDFTGTLLEGKVATDLRYISFYFDFAANTGKERAVYIDNVQLVDMSVPTVGSDEPLPLGPEDQYDGGDLLANATAADKMGIFQEDMFSYDAASTNVNKTGDVGQYSVVSWKFTAAAGESGTPTALISLPQSVDMTGKVLALDAFIENGNGNLSVHTLFNSGWGRLNASENAANYPNSTVSGKWVTLYYDVNTKLAEGKDLSDVKFIKFQFSFKENLTVEQNVYIDNVRLVDPSEVPPADDTKLDWTNMPKDAGDTLNLEYEYSGDYVKGEGSVKSLHLIASETERGKYSFNVESAVLNGELDASPDVYGGLIGAWFYFGSQEPAATFKVTEAGWKGSVEQEFTFSEGVDGWYFGTVDGSQTTFTETSAPGRAIRMHVFIPAGYEVYIDSMNMTDTETVAEDWIKMQRDNGPTMSNVTVSFDTEMLKADNSIQSLYIAAPAEERGMITFHTQAAFGKDFDMTGGKLGAWFYFGEQEANAILQLNGNNKSSNEVPFRFIASEEGWAYGVVDMYDVTYAEAEGTSANTLRLSILIPAGYTVYMDGFTYDPNAATDGSELATDLLGGATVNAADWTEEKGLTIGQDSENTTGGTSMRSWLFKASAAANTTATVKFTLAESVDFTDRYLMFDAKSSAAQNILVQLWNAEGTDALTYAVNASVEKSDWSSYIVNFGGSIMDGADLTAVGAISFVFDFASNTGAERSVNIDNVSLMDAETAEQDWIHKEQVTEEGFKTAQLSLSAVFSKADGSWISMKVLSPADAAGKFTLKIADGMKHRGTLGAWFYFGDQEASASVTTVESGENVSSSLAFTFGENQDGWYYGTVDLSDMEYADGVNRALINKITVELPAGYTVYVDGLLFKDITETAADDLINLDKAQYGECSFELDTENVKDDQSLHSLSMTATGGVDFAQTSAMDFSNGVLSCWIYYPNGHTDGEVIVQFYQGTNSRLESLNMTIAESAQNGWYKATLDLSEYTNLDSVDFIRIRLRNQAANLDYLLFEKNETAE